MASYPSGSSTHRGPLPPRTFATGYPKSGPPKQTAFQAALQPLGEGKVPSLNLKVAGGSAGFGQNLMPAPPPARGSETDRTGYSRPGVGAMRRRPGADIPALQPLQAPKMISALTPSPSGGGGGGGAGSSGVTGSSGAFSARAGHSIALPALSGDVNIPIVGTTAPTAVADPLLAILERAPVRLMAHSSPQALAPPLSSARPTAASPGSNDYGSVNIHTSAQAAAPLRPTDVRTDVMLLQNLQRTGFAFGAEDPLLAAAHRKQQQQQQQQLMQAYGEVPTSPRNGSDNGTGESKSNADTKSDSSKRRAGGGGGAPVAGETREEKDRRVSEWMTELSDAKKFAYRKNLPDHTHCIVAVKGEILNAVSGLFASQPAPKLQILKFHKNRAHVSDAVFKSLGGDRFTVINGKAFQEKIAQSGDDLWLKVYESETITVNPLQPVFKPVRLSAALLCEYESLRPILIRLWNFRDATAPEFIGEVRTNFSELMALRLAAPATSTASVTVAGGATVVTATPAASDADTKSTSGASAASLTVSVVKSNESGTASSRSAAGKLSLVNGEQKTTAMIALTQFEQIAHRPFAIVFGKKKRTTDTNVSVRIRISGIDVTSRGWSKDSPYYQLYVLLKAGDEEIVPGTVIPKTGTAPAPASAAPAGAASNATAPRFETVIRTRKGAEEVWALIATSNVCASTDSPQWTAINVPLTHLCFLSAIRSIRIVARHATNNLSPAPAATAASTTTATAASDAGVIGPDPVIGEVTTSLKKLLPERELAGSTEEDSTPISEDGNKAAAAAAAAAASGAGAAAGGDRKSAAASAAANAAAADRPPTLNLISESERAKHPKDYVHSGVLTINECFMFYSGERAKNLPLPSAAGSGAATATATTLTPTRPDKPKPKSPAIAAAATSTGSGAEERTGSAPKTRPAKQSGDHHRHHHRANGPAASTPAQRAISIHS